MNLTTEIKSKEDSLSALMSKILKEPLTPIHDSIAKIKEEVFDTRDQLEEIKADIIANGNYVDDVGKSLKRALNTLKDQALPDHMSGLRQHLSTLTTAGTSEVLHSLNAQSTDYIAQINHISNTLQSAITDTNNHQRKLSQSVEGFKELLNRTHEASLGEIRSSQEHSHRATVELTSRNEISFQNIATGLQKTTDFLGNALIDQQRASESANQIVLKELEGVSNLQSVLQQSLDELSSQFRFSTKVLTGLSEASTEIQARLDEFKLLEQSNSKSMESNQTSMTQLLAKQNTTLAAKIAGVQKNLNTLTITTSIFFVSMLSYVGYDIWSKFN